MKTIFLVDGDNNIGTGLKGIDMLSEQDAVLVFYQKTGLALSRLQKLCADTKAEVQYIESIRGGKNSIDFQIITELGVLVGRGEADCAYVISQDKGYEAAMSAEEAILQMNLLDHDFYVFRNSDDDSISIVYQRKNGGYGLIVTDEEEERHNSGRTAPRSSLFCLAQAEDIWYTTRAFSVETGKNSNKKELFS